MLAGQPDTVTAHVDALETLVVLLLARSLTEEELADRLESLQAFINADAVDRYRGDLEDRYDQLYQVRAIKTLLERAIRKRRGGEPAGPAGGLASALLGD